MYMPKGNPPGVCTVPPEKGIQPGEVRNPMGAGANVMSRELKRAFREKTLDALNTLYEVMMNKHARPFDRVRAAESILDRAWGRPKESVDIDISGGTAIVFADILKNEANRQADSGFRIVNEE